MALIISWQFMASPASPRTLAAASIALSFLGLASLELAFGALAAPFLSFASAFSSFAPLLFLAFGALLVFFALMMPSQNGSRWVGCHRQATGTHPCAGNQLPRGPTQIKAIPTRIVLILGDATAGSRPREIPRILLQFALSFAAKPCSVVMW